MILLERFIDKDKLDEKEIGYLTGLDKVDDYAKKLEEIKNNDVSQEEVDKVVEDINSMIKSTNMLFYTPNEFFGAYPVVSIESLSEDYIASLANSGALFVLSYISFMHLVDIKDIEIDSLYRQSSKSKLKQTPSYQLTRLHVIKSNTVQTK